MKRLPLVVAALALVAGSALAAVLSTTEKRLAIGTTFDVDGTEFAKPVSAWLDVSGKRVPLKALKGATDTHFTAQLRNLSKRAVGPCELKVRTKGSRIPATFAGMSIELPDAVAAIPPTLSAGEVLTIIGDYFGTKKGRVILDGRRAKVVSWTPAQIQAIVPQGVAGQVFLDVENKAGISETRLVVTVE